MRDKRIIHTKKNTYRIGLDEGSCFTIERQTGFDDNANPIWSEPWLEPSWCNDILKMIAQYADKHPLIQSL
jgi:hypothetical protein